MNINFIHNYKKVVVASLLLAFALLFQSCEDPVKASELEDLTLSSSLEIISSSQELSSSAMDSLIKISSSVLQSSSSLDSFKVDSNQLSSSLLSSAIQLLDTVSMVKFSQLSGMFTSAITLKLTSETAGAEIRYTLDGTAPNDSSTLYKDSILVIGSSSLSAVAMKDGMISSPVVKEDYEITGTVANPVFSRSAGSYAVGQSVLLTSITEGAKIYYTMDGSSPDSTKSLYSEAITVSSSQTLKAIAYLEGWITSAIVSATYQINGKLDVASISLAAGTYQNSQIATITCPSGATCYYTLNGETPTKNSSIVSGAITILSSATLKVIAIQEAWLDSDVISESYIITGKVATPTFVQAAGKYSSAFSLSISCPSDANCFYTTNGTTPSSSSFALNGDILITITTTVKVIAYRNDWTDSDVASATYTIISTVAAPQISPSGGTFVTDYKDVTFSSSTSNVTLHYTIDGSVVTTSSPISIDGKITLFPNNTGVTPINLQVMAVKLGWNNSAVTSKTFTLTRYCVVNPGNCFTDIRDNKKYRKTTINGKVWMAENLNYGTKVTTSGSKQTLASGKKICYDDDETKCSKDGALYQWHVALGLNSNYMTSMYDFPDGNIRGVCPHNWHIPSKSEWDALSSEGVKLKSTSFGGNNASNFNARAVGYMEQSCCSSSFKTETYYARFWEPTQYSGNNAVNRYMTESKNSISIYANSDNGKQFAVSVRCVQD